VIWPDLATEPSVCRQLPDAICWHRPKGPNEEDIHARNKSHNAKHLVAGVTALAVASAMAVATAAAASATPPVSKPVEDLHIVLPAGLACAFDLRVDGTGSKQTVKTFTDQGGNEVKVTLVSDPSPTLPFATVATTA
jgi:hypothetical protein